MFIGLTGGIGSGKSTVAAFFRTIGIPVIDSDAIAHRLLTKTYPTFDRVVKHFGVTILDATGAIDRQLLRTRVFQNSQERAWLEAELHPLIRIEIQKARATFSSPYAMVEIPLLIEAQFEDLVDRILVIDCTEALQIERSSVRTSFTPEAVRAIMSTQTTRPIRLAKAHDIIQNEDSLIELEHQVKTLHHYYLTLVDKIA